MRTEELRALSFVGQALWADPQRSQALPMETLAAISLLDMAEERRLERVASAMLSRASLEGVRATAPGMGRAFYRLSAEERLVLSALHRGKWPYDRIGRILGKTKEQVAEMAWAARLDLACRPGSAKPIAHPVASSSVAPSCPEYELRRPWTQAFLDEQLSAQQRIFLQEHLNRCAPCHEALSRTRALYFAVEAMTPRVSDVEQRVSALEKAVLRGRAFTEPSELTVLQSLEVFFSRREIRSVLLAGAILMALAMGPW